MVAGKHRDGRGGRDGVMVEKMRGGFLVVFCDRMFGVAGY